MALRSLFSPLSRYGVNLHSMAAFHKGYTPLKPRNLKMPTFSPTATHAVNFASDAGAAPPVDVPERDILYKKLDVEVRGHDPAVLKSYEWFTTKVAKELDISHTETLVPKKHLERLYLLKSIFVHRKHLVQYEMRTHFRIMRFKHLTGSTADTFLEYIQRNLPEGVAMKVTKVATEKMPSHLLSTEPELNAKDTSQ